MEEEAKTDIKQGLGSRVNVWKKYGSRRSGRAGVKAGIAMYWVGKLQCC